ncbi:MAG: hypothetical protein PW792_05155 [Acidobacteriaceae bacterium]|nr:hypothetical protein [Acidobacteriaceae bacterium]
MAVHCHDSGVFDTPINPSPLTFEKPISAQDLALLIPFHPGSLLRMARESRIPHMRVSKRKVLFFPSKIQSWLIASGYTTADTRAASTVESEAA